MASNDGPENTPTGKNDGQPSDPVGTKAQSVGLSPEKKLSEPGTQTRKLGFFSRILAFMAGADVKVLEQCPDSDRKYINQLGLSLLLSGSILYFISFGAIVASGLATTPLEIGIFGAICALLVLIVMSIDRSFIMADWFSEAESQLAGQTIGKRSKRAAARGFTFLVRIVLSVSIAFVFSILAETYIYRESVNKLIEQEHAANNEAIFKQLDDFRAEQENLLTAKRQQVAAQDQFVQQTSQRFLDLSANRPGDGNEVKSLNTQMGEIEVTIARLNRDIDLQKQEFQRQSDIAIAETAGEAGPGLTARAGCGRACRAAISRAELAEAEIERLTGEVAALSAQRNGLFEEAKQASDSANAQFDALLASVRLERDQEQAKLDILRQELVDAEQSYEQVVNERAAFIETQPGFVPKASGLAKRFSVLKQVYEQNQIWLEVIGLKLFIMMVEMAPILIKYSSSPRTQYSVKLNKAVYLQNFEDETERLRAASDFMEQSLRYAQQAHDYRQQAPEAPITPPNKLPKVPVRYARAPAKDLKEKLDKDLAVAKQRAPRENPVKGTYVTTPSQQ